MPRWLFLLLCLPLVACPSGRIGDDDDDDDSASDDDDATGDDDDSTPEGPAPAALAALSDGECPAWDRPGEVITFSSGGEERRLIVDVPSTGGAGKPVMFYWHALGTDPQYWYDNFGLSSVADAYDVTVIIPDSRDAQYTEWDWAQGADAVLYDDLRTCAVDELGADIRRVYTAGFSAGGLWSTYLTMHRADTLAAAYVMSGGVIPDLPLYPMPYVTPATTVPVLGSEGGADDTWSAVIITIDFRQAMLDFTAALVDDGHFTILCSHNGGHTPPPDGLNLGMNWLLGHEYGYESPFIDERADEIPGSCVVVE